MPRHGFGLSESSGCDFSSNSDSHSGLVWGHSGLVWGHSGLVWGHSGLVWGHSGLVWGHSGLVWGHSGLVLVGAGKCYGWGDIGLNVCVVL